MSYHWNWGAFLQQPPTGESSYLEWMVSGLWMTLTLSVSAWLIALVVGLLVGILRTVPIVGLQLVARSHVELFRNIPLMVQLFIWYYVIPEFLPIDWGDEYKQLDPAIQRFSISVIGLGLFTSARLAEHVRAGLEALSMGQKNAGIALGLSLPQTYRYVLMPMALRMMLPTLTSELMNIFKNSAVCSTIGVVELSYQAGALAECQSVCVPYESFIFITMAYLALNLLTMVLMRRVERWVWIPGFLGKH
jgi:glutamate/aspartate transport system permease protein